MNEIFITSLGLNSKGWGDELVIHDSKDYFGKILRFKENSEISMHYHIVKRETWSIVSGSFFLKTINPETAEEIKYDLLPGDVIEIPPGSPHQVKTITGGEIFEVSTADDAMDNYRIRKGDSQR